MDQGFGLMINTLPFADSNDKIKSIYHDESVKSINCLFVQAQTQFILLTFTSYHKICIYQKYSHRKECVRK